ncbi:MAG: hypothetical protein EOP07_10260 [Proteobacteria bacterium]|nr:MAG: hypothetical protein EOP07_10260 [Pseudomonadota bacterium]
MKILVLILSFLSTSLYAADSYDYVAKKAKQNASLTILENAPDYFTARDARGVQFSLNRAQVTSSISTMKQVPGMETDSVVEAVFSGKNLSYLGDLKAQRYIAKGTRLACGTMGAACGILAGATAEFILPVVVGSACVAVAAECVSDASTILTDVERKINLEIQRLAESSLTGGGAGSDPQGVHDVGGGSGLHDTLMGPGCEWLPTTEVSSGGHSSIVPAHIDCSGT